MENPTENQRGQKTEDFLLVEYKNFADLFWRNEEAGERRVSFFITLVTAVIGALVALATRKESLVNQVDVFWVAVFALLGLLGFGIVTFLRMLHRNRVTDEYKRAMDLIRTYFREGDDRLRDYQPFEKRKVRRMGTGGLVDMVALVNSLIAAALFALLTTTQTLIGWIVGVAALTGFFVAWLTQLVYVKRRYESESKAHAGETARN